MLMAGIIEYFFVNKIANNVVYQITNNGLVALNGTYTAPNGSKYIINNGNISK